MNNNHDPASLLCDSQQIDELRTMLVRALIYDVKNRNDQIQKEQAQILEICRRLFLLTTEKYRCVYAAEQAAFVGIDLDGTIDEIK